MSRRINRSLEDMFQALARQVRVLDAFIEKAETGDLDYLPEIAAKLRILLVKKGNNRPLLLDLASRVNCILTLTPLEGTDRTPHNWPQFLERATTTTVPGEAPRVVTNGELICMWAEQAGGAHEDWVLKQSFVELASFPGRVGGSGLLLSHHNLITMARNASKSAHTLLANLESLRKIKAVTDAAERDKTSQSDR